MTKWFWVFAIAEVTGCSTETSSPHPPLEPSIPSEVSESKPAGEPLPVAEEFFADWLKSHGHQDVVMDANGIGVSSSPTRMKATLYGLNEHDGGVVVVETEFRILLPSGREIIEFVAGFADSKENAIADTLKNFTLSTFHVVYKAFINPDDAHVNSKKTEIGGQQRDVIAGDIYMLGLAGEDPLDLDALILQIEQTLKDVSFDENPHWIKVVYSQSQGEPNTVAVTIDNEVSADLTDKVTRLDWPQSKSFYMAKQFIVVN